VQTSQNSFITTLLRSKWHARKRLIRAGVDIDMKTERYAHTGIQYVHVR